MASNHPSDTLQTGNGKKCLVRREASGCRRIFPPARKHRFFWGGVVVLLGVVYFLSTTFLHSEVRFLFPKSHHDMLG